MLQVQLFFRLCLDQILALGPYVVLGALSASLLRRPVAKYASELLGGAEVGMLGLLSVSLLAVMSPLCTFGTVPFVLVFLSHGGRPSLAASFLVSSSLMNPQLFLITWWGLGAELALLRVVSAVLAGTTCGMLLLALQRRGARQKVPPPSGPSRGILRETLRNLEHMAPYLLAGIAIASAIRLLPMGKLLAGAFSEPGWLSVGLAALLGVPFYACGGATVPVLAALRSEGMTEAAILAFLIAGPATRITALSALFSVFSLPLVVGYCLFIVAWATLWGQVGGWCGIYS